MARKELQGLRIATLAADGFEQVELTMPMKELHKHGAVVEVISLRPGSIKGMNLLIPGKTVRVDRLVDTANADIYDGLLLPGGFINPDFLRQSDSALNFVRAFDQTNKPIAVICHGPWLLVSAGLVNGRRLTSWPGIKDDIINAGGEWVNEAVVRDRNWLSSRGPQDIFAFNKAIVEFFAERNPVAESALKREERGFPLGRWVMGGVVLAGAGYALRRLAQAGYLWK